MFFCLGGTAGDKHIQYKQGGGASQAEAVVYEWACE